MSGSSVEQRLRHLGVGLHGAAVELAAEVLAQRLRVDLEVCGDVVLAAVAQCAVGADAVATAIDAAFVATSRGGDRFATRRSPAEVGRDTLGFGHAQGRGCKDIEAPR